jgi:hypothetical protein
VSVMLVVTIGGHKASAVTGAPRQCLCFWGYLKSAFFIALPLVLWHSSHRGLDLGRWEETVLSRFWRALGARLLACALVCVAAVAAAVALDCLDCGRGVAELSAASQPGPAAAMAISPLLCSGEAAAGRCESFRRLVRGQGLLPSTQALAALGAGASLAWLLCWTLVAAVARYKNRAGRDAGFWFALSKCGRKAALLLLVVSYLPVARVLLDNVRPVDARPVNGSAPVAKWGFPAGGCAVVDGVAADACPDYPAGPGWFLEPAHVMFPVKRVERGSDR